MSQANVQALLEKAQSHPELQIRIARIFNDAAKQTAEALSQLSQGTRNAFTAEDFLAQTAAPSAASPDIPKSNPEK